MNSPEDIRALALDVGGTNIRRAVVGQSGHIIARQQCNTSLSHMDASSSDQAETEILRILISSITDMQTSHSGIHTVGIGFPGFFRQETGILVSSPNIPCLINFPLAERLSDAVSLPVHVQNDAALAALGEFRFGIGRKLKNLLHLTLGTGVGGGLILNGIPYLGESGMSVEIGHSCVVPNGRACGCGGSGCLEAYASASGVVTRYAETEHQHATNAEEIYRKALEGDVVAAQILREAGSYLGQAIAEAVKLLDVHNVSISGGLAGAWSFLSEPMNASLNEKLIPPLKGKVRLHRSRLADDAGLLGAAILALENGFQPALRP